MESRIATLEERTHAHGEAILALGTKLDAIVASLGRLETLAALANSRVCPAPGKCLELDAALKKLTGEVEAMKTRLDEIGGGWKLLVFVSGLAGTIGAGLGWLLTQMGFHK